MCHYLLGGILDEFCELSAPVQLEEHPVLLEIIAECGEDLGGCDNGTRVRGVDELLDPIDRKRVVYECTGETNAAEYVGKGEVVQRG